jgi:methylenetetrahydrofolate dehydrogenase (NADP+)/methenyltetrahydrofolate cyclohydrolase
MKQEEAIIIDGKKIAAELRAKIANQVASLQEKHHITPGLAVILAGNNPASEIYVRNKVNQTIKAGMNSFVIRLEEEIHEQHLIAKIEHLNNDPKVHGILVQLPLPKQINEKAVINAINPDKDVDGFHVENVGKLVTNQDGFVPCTPLGCLTLLKTVIKDFTGLKAVVIGRSNIVGKPMAQLLLRENCTVTIAHAKTKNLEEECKSADIIIAAVGSPRLVKKDWVKEGAVLLDVGINRITSDDGESKLVGDVDFDEVKKVAHAISPVPGGVGPMTIASLLQNTLLAACRHKHIDPDSL